MMYLVFDAFFKLTIVYYFFQVMYAIALFLFGPSSGDEVLTKRRLTHLLCNPVYPLYLLYRGIMNEFVPYIKQRWELLVENTERDEIANRVIQEPHCRGKLSKEEIQRAVQKVMDQREDKKNG